MKKFILMSILIATFWLPVVASREWNLERTVELVRKRFLIFCVLYVLAVAYVIPRM